MRPLAAPDSQRFDQWNKDNPSFASVHSLYKLNLKTSLTQRFKKNRDLMEETTFQDLPSEI